MKIVIITQEDSFAVPANIQRLINLDFVRVVKIVNINSSHSLVNQKQLFIKGFGLAQSAKMAVQVFKNKLIEKIDSILSYKTKLPAKSLKAVSEKNGIPYEVITNPNDEHFLEKLNMIQPDIVVSFSAPLIFRKKLLDLPRLGCINLHCSFLPSFAGIMPSFWTLYNGEKTTGVTVHYMDSKIDNGKILGQKKVTIDEDETMFTLILKTKKEGGEVMCQVLEELHQNKNKALENCADQGSYFGWPKIEELQHFRKNGGRLI